MFRNKLLFYSLIIIIIIIIKLVYSTSDLKLKYDIKSVEAPINPYRSLNNNNNNNNNNNSNTDNNSTNNSTKNNSNSNNNNNNNNSISNNNKNKNSSSNSNNNKININYNNKPILKYNSNGKFKIVQFTDLHYGEGEIYDSMNERNQEIILEIEKPDFVMLSGDMISGYNYHKRDNYIKAWERLTKPMVSRGIPWSITFGNHDCEGLLTCKEIATLDMTYNLSLTEINSIIGLPGVTNYQLNIFASDYQGDGMDIENSESVIYIFDSDTNGCRHSEAWGCIQKPQVDWYQNLSNSNNRKDAIAFVHIPPNEIIDLWNNGIVSGDFGDSSVCCYYTDQSKFVEKMIQQGDVKGLYFGHDHKNDFHGNYYGIDLGYGRKSGYGSYNPKYLEGARILELDNHPFKINTWIRDNAGNQDFQKDHTPSQFSQFPIYCCRPGDPREGPWVQYMVIFIISSFILAAFALFKKRSNKLKIKKSTSGSSIEFKPIQNQ